jgi:UDP-GlcNAc:undecaprenyl-phosphate GlcNAc-1-phosphate transferase
MLNFFLLFIVLSVGIEFIYIALARKFNITDKPSYRSSHTEETVRGGGVIFPVMIFTALIIYGYSNWILFSIGLLILAVVSFIDDVRGLSSKLRLIIHSLVIFTFTYFTEPSLNWVALLCYFVLITGVINIYNFMDGINGITALYSIITIGSLFWINQYVNFIITPLFFISILSALIVFSFLNVRTKAICFAGDVGSVSLAFIISFLLLKQTLSSGNMNWIFLLGVYFIDTSFTIFCRILRKENIIEAHRTHFYQFLVNERKISHLKVSSIYAFTQLILNIIVIYSYEMSMPLLPVVSLFLFFMTYIIFRFQMEGKHKLFSKYYV